MSSVLTNSTGISGLLSDGEYNGDPGGIPGALHKVSLLKMTYHYTIIDRIFSAPHKITPLQKKFKNNVGLEMI